MMDITSRGNIPPLHVLNDAFFIALRDGGNGRRYDKKQAMNLAQEFLDEREDGIFALAEIFFVTLAVSGLLGDDFRKGVLEKFEIDNKDPEIKNESKAKAK